MDDQVERQQIASLRARRAKADAGAIEHCLAGVRRAAATNENLLGPIIEAARARASVGEIMSSLEQVFGRYEAKIA